MLIFLTLDLIMAHILRRLTLLIFFFDFRAISLQTILKFTIPGKNLTALGVLPWVSCVYLSVNLWALQTGFNMLITSHCCRLHSVCYEDVLA